jgi:BirA family biotin operon repressor/biotin-[acetyl-CoA-carboxylase] ligase
MAVSVTVPLPQAHIGWVPLLAGLAVAEAIESSAFLRADLKWPNDVLLPADGGGKVCGVLGEVLSEHHLAVVGAGINVSQHREQLPVETATSLALAGATRVDRSSLLQAYLSRFAFWYASLGRAKPGSGWSEPGEASVTASTDLTHLREAYRSRCVTIGQQVRLTRPHDSDLIGDAVAVDDDGRLVIETKVGRSAWAAGDVTHVRARG